MQGVLFFHHDYAAVPRRGLQRAFYPGGIQAPERAVEDKLLQGYFKGTADTSGDRHTFQPAETYPAHVRAALPAVGRFRAGLPVHPERALVHVGADLFLHVLRDLRDRHDPAADKSVGGLKTGLKKDFVDLFFILQSHKPAEILKWAERKFPDHPTFSVQAAKALIYFEDAEKEPMPRMLKHAAWNEIRTFFEKEIPKLFNL